MDMLEYRLRIVLTVPTDAFKSHEYISKIIKLPPAA